MNRNEPSVVLAARAAKEDELNSLRQERDRHRRILESVQDSERRLKLIEGEIWGCEQDLTDLQYPVPNVPGLEAFVVIGASDRAITLRCVRGTYRVTVTRADGYARGTVRRIVTSHFEAILSQWRLWCQQVGTPPDPDQVVYAKRT